MSDDDSGAQAEAQSDPDNPDPDDRKPRGERDRQAKDQGGTSGPSAEPATRDDLKYLATHRYVLTTLLSVSTAVLLAAGGLTWQINGALGDVRGDLKEVKAKQTAIEELIKKQDVDSKGEIKRLDQRIDRLEDRINRHFGSGDGGAASGGRSGDHEKRRQKFCAARCPVDTSTCYINCEPRFDECADKFKYYSPEFYKCLAVDFGPIPPGGTLYAPLPDSEWKSKDWAKPRAPDGSTDSAP